MPHNILILDDDQTFNDLLSDVFIQAGYEVESFLNPKEALDDFGKNVFDLVVTDQDMPGMTGVEFIRKIKSLDNNMPIIMVSGKLNEASLRDLIKEGMAGIFLKPLNVFSLLKKTGDMIEKIATGAPGASWEKVTVAGRPEFGKNLPFRFQSFPCISGKSADFAKKLYSLRDFDCSLILHGKEGDNFTVVCRDLGNFANDNSDEFILLDRENFGEHRIPDCLRESVEKGAKQVTFVILEPETLPKNESGQIVAILRKIEPFTDLPMPVRLVFCFKEDIDTLYDNGQLDEALYLILGASEIRIPALGECLEDIPMLAQLLLYEQAEAEELEVAPQLDVTGISYLMDYNWPGSFAELKKIIEAAMELAGGTEITSEDLRCAFATRGGNPSRLSFKNLDSYLRDAREDYAVAVLDLCEGDAGKAAGILKVEADFLQSIVPA